MNDEIKDILGRLASTESSVTAKAFGVRADPASCIGQVSSHTELSFSRHDFVKALKRASRPLAHEAREIGQKANSKLWPKDRAW